MTRLRCPLAFLVSATLVGGLLGAANFKTQEDWEPRLITRSMRGGLSFATTAPLSDVVCWSAKEGDAWANFLAIDECVLSPSRQIRILAFGVTLTDGDPFSMAPCDVRVQVNDVGEVWSRMELGTGRDPGTCVAGPPPGGDLNAAGEFCWKKNPNPVAITASPGTLTFLEVAGGDGDGVCPDASLIDTVQVTVFIEQRSIAR